MVVLRLMWVLVVAGLSLTACGDPANRLEVLRADPMAAFAPSVTHEASQSETGGSTGPGKSAPATYRRTFQMTPDAVPAAVDEAVAAARDAGYELRPALPDGFSGEHSRNGLVIQISIFSIPADGVVRVDLSTSDS